MTPSKTKVFLILSAGMVAISLGSILVRFSQEAPSLVIAFYRMFWATLFISPFFWLRKPRYEVFLDWKVLAAGLALALHFAFWVHSLRFTSVAVSVLLVNTSPVLVATLSFFIFREKLTLKGILGLLLAFIGASILFWNDLNTLLDWRGPVFALLGAAAVGFYLIFGRKIRQKTSLVHYIYPTYAYAALALGLMVLLTRSPIHGFSWDTYLFLLLLGLVPQSLGHSSYNWSLEFLPATLVSTLILVEPILATLFAWWILGEAVTDLVVLGGILVGSGIYCLSRWGIEQR